MGKKKTHEQFVEEVYALVGDEYTILGKYTKSSIKLKIKHNTCGYIYEVTPSSFFNNKRCPKCNGGIKTTHKEFINYVYNSVGEEYSVLGEYVNNKTKIKIKHNTCGHIYMVQPRSFKQGARCPKCANNIKKTTEQFREEVLIIGEGKYNLLSEYKNSKTKVKLRHIDCNYEYEVLPNAFIRGNRCPKCSGLMKKTTEQFKEEVYNLVGDEYSVLGKYVNTKTSVEIKHNVCGHIYKVTPANFLTGYKCPKCSNNIKKTTEQFKKEIYDLVGDEYTILGDYVDAKTPVKIKHNRCGEFLHIKPNNFFSGCRCAYCSNKIKKTTEQFKKEVYDLIGDEYTILGGYINNHTKIKIKHNTCGHIYEVTPKNFLNNKRRCPKCNSSKGETKILNILDEFHIRYKPQFKFKDCKYKSYLPFDLAVFKNNELVLLIEYDGIQHYKSVERFGGKKEFNQTKIRDKIKTDYCIKNNIPLLRIPYWKFNDIDKIVLKRLFRLGLI